jgi:hypothetical protein
MNDRRKNDAITLTVRKRSCLLRAARARLAQLHEEYDALRRVEMIDEQSWRLGQVVKLKREELSSEIGCIADAIRWLWSQPATE